MDGQYLASFGDIQKQPPEVFYKKAVLKNFAIFSGKHLQDRCFPVNIAKFLRTLLLKNICERQLLDAESKV